jgi:hypothetical protein
MEAVAEHAVNGTARAAEQITIKPLNMERVELRLVGTAPYMQLRFSEKARAAMRARMEEGSTAKSRRARSARDFDADYEAAMYVTEDGRRGIPASAFRNAAIDACRMAGYQMTKAKCSIFTVADDADVYDGTPLVYIEGEPEKNEMTVRNETGVADIRVRARWVTWAAVVTIRFDADQFKREDIVNLFWRAGAQVGIGEGRPFSKKSNGIGLGTFEIAGG